ncbi:MAG: hypothetical protein OES25_07720 [Acidobacteriota bacterium]|nr:hypothetical protein [Acidobacteriota bacterium]
MKCSLTPGMLLCGLLAFASTGPIHADMEPSPAEKKQQARQTLLDAIEGTQGGDERVLLLAELAWPDPSVPRNAWVAFEAHKELIAMGESAVNGLARVVADVDPTQAGDVVLTIIAARTRQTSGVARSFLPAMDRAVWFGSLDARRLAIPQLAKRQSYGTLPACVDAALEEPSLLPLVIRSTVGFRRDSARHFLKTQLESGDAELRQLAAESLARIGGRARDTLREATLSDSLEIQESSLRAWLPLTGTNDITTLYEYLARRDEEEVDELMTLVGERAMFLEALLETEQEHEGHDHD